MPQLSKQKYFRIAILVGAALVCTTLIYPVAKKFASNHHVPVVSNIHRTGRPPLLSKSKASEQKSGLIIAHSYDKYLNRLAIDAAIPKFTEEELKSFLTRRGRDTRTLVFAALTLRDPKYLEEARSIDAHNVHVVHCDAQFAIDAIRQGDSDALANIVKLVTENPESAGLQMALLYATWLEEHFVKSKRDAAAENQAVTAVKYLQMLPRTGLYPTEEVSFRDMMYDILRHEKGINNESALILKTYSDPYPLTPAAGGNWLLTELVEASRALDSQANIGNMNEFAARQLALITNTRDSTKDLIAKQALLEQELEFLHQIANTNIQIQPYLSVSLEQYKSELAEDLSKCEELTTRFFDIIYGPDESLLQGLNPNFNAIDKITSRLNELSAPQKSAELQKHQY